MSDNSKSPVEDHNVRNKRVDDAPNDDRSLPSKEDPAPCCHTMGSRNLIVCIDGTANQFGLKNTNVIELYNLILKEEDDNQHTWYNSGIGTYARPSWKSLKYCRKVLYHKIDLAIAWDFERTVLAAYRWLSDNYKSGDCIFLFGFSRGAFQVRVLSAMIDKVGLIYKGNEMQIPFAYELYCDPDSDKPSSLVTRIGSPETQRELSLAQRFMLLFSNKIEDTQTQENTTMADRFKSAFAHKNVRVHFVGAWDTVSSIGIARGTCMLPRTVDGMTHVCYFRHALALDERRVKFSPEYAYGGSAKFRAGFNEQKPPKFKQNSAEKGLILPTRSDDDATSTATPKDHVSPAQNNNAAGSKVGSKPTENPPHTLEVWFAGTHSDIGGGNANNPAMDRSRPPLRWMVFEAGALGLRTARFDRVLLPHEQVEIRESLTLAWWPLELFCLKRLTYTREEHGKQTTHKPHLGSSRKIHVGQKIHGSLTLTDKTRYTPKARPPTNDPPFWDKVRKEGLGEWRAVDLYEHTQTLVKKFVDDGDGTVWQNLRQTATSGDGRQAVYEGVIEALKVANPQHGVSIEVKHRLITNAIDVLAESARKDTSLRLCRSWKVKASMADIWKGDNEEYQKTAWRFMEQFADFEPLVLTGHTQWVLSVAFSPDSKRVISGSGDETVRIWDAETGKQIGEPFRGHTDPVLSVAFSPDGKRVISGSVDKTVRIWDAETGKQIEEPFRGHTYSVRSVAFSPDSKRVILGSDDKTVRILDAETGKQIGEPFRGVRSIAFSPDGKRVISGSDDKTVRIWDAETGKQIGEPFREHTYSVLSVAFSPDGKQVISGSDDETVRIWDAETGKQIGEPFRGHTDWVWSVAFSPDGKRVISGSDDKTVRIWDAETGKQIGEPFRGHTDWVRSVAFSPDGKWVISGSEDKTVRIWDAETGKQIGEPFRKHTDDVRSVAFSPDGKRVISGSLDKTVRIWDAETGKQI